jgi:hypothetical protein
MKRVYDSGLAVSDQLFLAISTTMTLDYRAVIVLYDLIEQRYEPLVTGS